MERQTLRRFLLKLLLPPFGVIVSLCIAGVGLRLVGRVRAQVECVDTLPALVEAARRGGLLGLDREPSEGEGLRIAVEARQALKRLGR